MKPTKKNEKSDFSFIALIVGGVISTVLIFDFYQFYLFEGLGKKQAIIIAILVELCILYGACSSSKRLFQISKTLIAYNAIIFSFFGILQFGEYTKNFRYIEERIAELKFKLESLGEEKNELQEHLGSLYDKNVVTQASKSIFPEIQRIEDKISSTDEELQILLTKALESDSHSSWQKGLSLALMVVLRLILQIFSIEIIHAGNLRAKKL